eukprot:scaffold148914_cov47-Attheya_sp.AAC.3
MAESSKTNTTSPTKASNQTKIPSPRRKRDGFSKKNNIETIAKQNHCEIKVMTTLGDEEIFLFLKPENEIKIDAYSRHFKEDLHWEGPIQENLNLVAGFPRRKSHESTTKTRLLAAQAVAEYPLSTYDTNTYRTP